MTQPKLPADLVTWNSFQAELALTPIVVECLAIELGAHGAFIQIPGQPGKYVSRAVAFQALEAFVERTGIRGQLADIKAVRKANAKRQAFHDATVKADLMRLKK